MQIDTFWDTLLEGSDVTRRMKEKQPFIILLAIAPNHFSSVDPLSTLDLGIGGSSLIGVSFFWVPFCQWNGWMGCHFSCGESSGHVNRHHRCQGEGDGKSRHGCCLLMLLCLGLEGMMRVCCSRASVSLKMLSLVWMSLDSSCSNSRCMMMKRKEIEGSSIEATELVMENSWCDADGGDVPRSQSNNLAKLLLEWINWFALTLSILWNYASKIGVFWP